MWYRRTKACKRKRTLLSELTTACHFLPWGRLQLLGLSLVCKKKYWIKWQNRTFDSHKSLPSLRRLPDFKAAKQEQSQEPNSNYGKGRRDSLSIWGSRRWRSARLSIEFPGEPYLQKRDEPVVDYIKLKWHLDSSAAQSLILSRWSESLFTGCRKDQTHFGESTTCNIYNSPICNIWHTKMITKKKMSRQ